MHRTFRERIVSKFTKFVKKYPILKFPALGVMMLFLSAYYIVQYFASNGKRFASIGLVILFFVFSSSFAFPGFTDDTELEPETELVSEVSYIYDSDVALVQDSEEVSVEDTEILDDDDVLEGYSDAELDSMDEADKYTLDELLEANSERLSENGQSEEGSTDEDDTVTAEDAGEEKVVFDKSDWRLVLINKQHPIPDDYTFTLGTIKGSMQCDERIIDDLFDMLQGAKDDGVNLVICSPYRDMNRQIMLFNRKITKYMSRGMSYLEAYSLASQAVTVPGASEHQIGLALDIVCDTYSNLNAGFGDTEAGKWLAEHCSEYGFILRYPLGKENITGIEYEPWHFRYVGHEAAEVIMDEGITLEEFVERLN